MTKKESAPPSPSMMRVLVVDDEQNAAAGLKELIGSWGYDVMFANDGRQALEAVRRFQPNVILSDLVMPEMDGLQLLQTLREENLMDQTTFIILSAHGNIGTAVEAIKRGAHDFITKPLDVVRLKILLENLSRRMKVDAEVSQLRDKVRKLGTFGKLNGSTPKMKNVFKQIQVIAPTVASVFIEGESGTGKELVAKAIHQYSKRLNQPYIAVNCSSVPEHILETELFGQERGDTIDPGAFELANTGSIFLDEVGEMSQDLELKLLRVLETGELRRVGGKEEIPVDVRVIASSNRKVEELVEEKAFREDLYYRLNVFNIKLPPLRERAEDIPLLTQNFIEEFNLKNDRSLKGATKEAMNLLKRYTWPGNVRELKNTLERAVVVCQKEMIDVDDLPETLTSKAHKVPIVEFRLGQTMDEVEKQFLFHTIAFADGNKTKAAKMLDISLKTLHNKLAKYKSSV